MNNELTLMATEKFENVNCDFYKNRNDNAILLTREQIGTALGYSNPSKAIQKIHLNHKQRLEPLCVRLSEYRYPTSGGVGIEVEKVYYTERGAMELCRFSQKPKADTFMDWVWDIIEKYRHGELTTNPQTPTISEDAIRRIIRAELQQTNNKSKSVTLPSPKFSTWKTKTFEKFKAIQKYVNEHSDQELTLPRVMGLIFNELADTYDIDLSEYEYMYRATYSIPEDIKVQTLDIIASDTDLKKMFNLTIDSIIDKLHIKLNTSTRNIFDELAAQC